MMSESTKVFKEADMSRIGLFYGSNDGHTADVAERIKKLFDRLEPGLVAVFDIGSAKPEDLMGWDLLIFGIPTWNIGLMQDDWDIFFPSFADLDLSGKKIAIYGLGDQYGYTMTFLDAVGFLGEEVLERGAVLVGYWPTQGYQFEGSLALDSDDYFMGLALDEDNEARLTDERLERWVTQIAEEFGLTEKHVEQ
jgi:flavodoxin I